MFDKDALRKSVRNIPPDTLASPPETDATPAEDNSETLANPYSTLLQRYSLTGTASELEKEIEEQHPFLGSVCLSGQATVWYAKPNTGKTLLALHLMIDAVANGRIDPAKVYYIAADDSAHGLVEKLHILEEYGINVLAPGHAGFEAKSLVPLLTGMIKGDAVNGLYIVADTLKKFMSLMDKNEGRAFGELIRQFTMKGGTFLALAHTNKQRSNDGKLVYAGTSDIVEDVDCAYIIDELDGDAGRQERVVEFECIKRRGNVAQNVAYSFTIESGASYASTLASVQEVDSAAADGFRKQAEVRSDASIIAAIENTIKEGTVTKMELARTVGAREGLGRQSVVKIIERYTGHDPANHRWTFTVGARGKKVFQLTAGGAAPLGV